MRVSICVGNYATTPYCIPGIGINVYCMEELCYCMKENAFLLDFSVMNDALLKWIEQECGLYDLARALSPLVHKSGSLSAFVVTLMKYTGFYDSAQTEEVERVLKQGAGLSLIEKKKSQTDYLVKKKKYKAAITGYDRLIEKWQEQTDAGEPLPAAGCLADIWHNRGVALTGLMLYRQAAECFLQAYEMDGREEFLNSYLAAKRMELSEEEYVAFAAGNGLAYESALALEKKVEQLIGEWEMQPEYLKLYNNRELRSRDDRQRYYDENERITQTLKESYRNSVSN